MLNSDSNNEFSAPTELNNLEKLQFVAHIENIINATTNQQLAKVRLEKLKIFKRNIILGTPLKVLIPGTFKMTNKNGLGKSFLTV
jgi:hypothetical protein